MLCPICHTNNPDSNRFCGHCGSALATKSTTVGRRGNELPKELVDFDRKIPLIAEPGSDRRNSVPEKVREQARELFERDRSREIEEEKAQEEIKLARMRDAEQERQREAERLRAAEASRMEREVERRQEEQRRQEERRRQAESERIHVAVPANENRTVWGASGLLGLNIVDEPDRDAPVKTVPVEKPRLTTRAANNHFLNLDYEPPSGGGGVSGPSFLGLSDSPEDVEQDEPEGHARRNVALVVLVLLIGLGATQWHQIRDQALPFVKNGTQKVLLKVKGKQAQPANDDSSNASNANGGTPNIEVAPTNDNLKKAEPPANTAAANAPAENPSAANEPSKSTPASDAATEANSTATTGGVTGAATNDAGATEESKSANDVAKKTSGTKKSDADETETAKADEETAAPAKAAAKKSADTSARKGKKPSAADRPQIEEEQNQAGSAELAEANAAADPTRQRQLLWQAVKKGNPDASVKLAEMYIMGRGVEKSCEQAMVLLRSASVHSSSRARGKLGAMYATGECVPQDRVQAYHWMSMALQANPNSDWTERYRESIWNQMTAGEKMRAGRER